jgi:hypothetical protein
MDAQLGHSNHVIWCIGLGGFFYKGLYCKICGAGIDHGGGGGTASCRIPVAQCSL